MTNRKSYMDFSKNQFLDPYDELDQQLTSPISHGKPRLVAPANLVPCLTANLAQ